MELSVSSVGGRREERLPLDVLVELRSDEGDEMLEADGIDVSTQGMAMRAAFVPPLGALLKCQFRCPPQGDPVRAEGEVVWAEWNGPRAGTFGVRFLGLDTLSATAIRRYTDPNPREPEPVEAPVKAQAQMTIDGVGAPVEADVRLSDAGRLVLEQELPFLRLGRGVDVLVPGRGKQRGRIGSIELRKGPLDTPTLVFGILLDESTQAESVPEVRASTREELVAAAMRAPLPELEVQEPAATASDTWPERAFEPEAPKLAARSTLAERVDQAMAALEASASREAEDDDELMHEFADEPVVVHRAVTRSKREDDAPREITVERAASEDAELFALQNRLSPAALAGKRALVTWLVRLRALLAPLFAQQKQSLSRAREQGVPVLRERFDLWLRQVRTLLATQRERLLRARATREPKQQKATPRVQRVQGGREPTAAVKEQGRAEAPQKVQAPYRPRNRRAYAVALALVGIGLGVYALAPRSGADRIRIPQDAMMRPTPIAVAADPWQAPANTAAPVEPEPSALPAQPATQAVPAASAQPVQPTQPTPGIAPVAPADLPASAPAASLRFGEGDVPNGRTFVLRMSGPVEDLEGDRREDGFTVRVPGRLALDRASPIATSHRAVARAMILNRGEYAELTVDFLPGMRPKYQVVAKDNTIEVTLERQ